MRQCKADKDRSGVAGLCEYLIHQHSDMVACKLAIVYIQSLCAMRSVWNKNTHQS